MSHIALNIDQGVATITLMRSDKFNSFIKEMAIDLIATLHQVAEDDAVRCIVITGSGKAFSAGQDLKEATDPNGQSLSMILKEQYNPIVTLIRTINKPIVAAVNGVAAGAGANIALACDIVIAAESASFIQAFSKIGLVPDSGGSYTLPRLVGLQRATALMMLGDKVMAKDALAMGMVYNVFSDDNFLAEVSAIALKLAQMPTYGLALTKQLLNASFDNSFKEQLELEDKLQTLASESEDYKEGTTAFIEKRTPIFKGK